MVDTYTDINTVFDPDWKHTLINEKLVRFHIPWDLENAKGYWRLHIKDIEPIFEGAAPLPDYKRPAISSGKGDEEPQLEYYVEIGPQVVDKDSTGKPIKYWLPKTGFSKMKGKGGWDDPPNIFAKPALFCHGQILINKASAMRWKTVTGVRLDWEVQGIWMKTLDLSVALERYGDEAVAPISRHFLPSSS